MSWYKNIVKGHAGRRGDRGRMEEGWRKDGGRMEEGWMKDGGMLI